MSRTILCVCAAALLAAGSLGVTTLRLGGVESGKVERQPASMVTRLFQFASLTDLPPAEQSIVELLLLLPPAALIICVFRNVIGLNSFGTFTPALLGLAFRDLRSWPGVLIFVAILLTGWLLRRALSRLHLLQAPRISLMLSLVIALLVGFVVVSNRLGWPATRYVVLFPLVILTGMIERLWTLGEEDGPRASFRTLAATLAIAGSISLVVGRPFIARQLLHFPEALGLIMSGQMLLGRYTGYRLTELYRFRDVLREPDPGELSPGAPGPGRGTGNPSAHAARFAEGVDFMHWLFGARQLARVGILAMNRRNAACILDHNPRALFPAVDDKLRLLELCVRVDVPTPEVFAVVERHAQLRRLSAMLAEPAEFVIKPNRGSTGRGVLVIIGRDGDAFLRHNGERLGIEDLRRHIADILAGTYSLGGQPDQALVQYRVQLHRAFAPVSFRGTPDVRVVVYRGQPVMAMLRLPTRASNGRANLHQGGIGAGVDMATGRTHHAIKNDRFVDRHPDTGVSLIGRQVPYWDEVLDMSRRVAWAVGLGYLGVDAVIDACRGPMILEANARPGLAIQLANASGLRRRLEEIDALHGRPARDAASGV